MSVSAPVEEQRRVSVPVEVVVNGKSRDDTSEK